jgi:hypothetical protein
MVAYRVLYHARQEYREVRVGAKDYHLNGLSDLSNRNGAMLGRVTY